MPLRAFTDQLGVRWEVWEAHPRLVERRLLPERRAAPRTNDRRRDPPSPDTRAEASVTEGWLVFHSANQRRRRQPIPPGWERLPESEMEALMAQARPSGPRSRVSG